MTLTYSVEIEEADIADVVIETLEDEIDIELEIEGTHLIVNLVGGNRILKQACIHLSPAIEAYLASK